MSACTFFGHRECYGLDTGRLQAAIESLIAEGVDTFYVGHQGRFDALALSCLEKLKSLYPHICYNVVLAYLPTGKPEQDLYPDCSIYPEGLEIGLPKYAIERRNCWMIEKSDYCLCYINHTWGGAYKFTCKAKHCKRTVVNLGDVIL